VLRLVVGLGLAIWLVALADPRSVLLSLSRATPSWLLAAVGLVLIDRTLMAYRWVLLLRARHATRDVPLWGVMRIFFVSTFLGTFLPASVGGDAVRALQLSRLSVPGTEALASVVVDRLLGTLSLLVMGVAGLVAVRQVLQPEGLMLLVGALALAIGGALLLLFDSRVLTALLRRVTPFGRLQRFVGRLLDSIREYGGHRQVLALVLVASVAVQVLRTLQAWCLGLAIGIPTGLSWYFAFIPIVVMAMSLPVSFMGLGTSQLSFQVLFGLVGVNEPDALALSALFLALGVVGNLPGGWLFMWRGWEPEPRDRVSDSPRPQNRARR
jgi:uncharacterized protein (TIRG00374 family)